MTDVSFGMAYTPAGTPRKGFIFDGLDDVGGLVLTAIYQPIPFTTELRKDDGYKHSTILDPSEITVGITAGYTITAEVGVVKTGGGSDILVEIEIQVDTGAGFSTLPSAVRSSLAMGAAVPDVNLRIIRYRGLEVDDKVRLVCRIDAGSADTIADESRLIMVRATA